jgi:YkoP domain
MGEHTWLSRPLKAGVRLIEYLVRKSMHVYEFTDDPDCILRIQLTTSPRSVDFGTWQISKGETILSIHAWNEKMPKIPREGATLEWAIQLRRQVVHSFQKVAEELQKGGKYSQVRAIYGESTIFSFSDHTGGLKMMQRLGFTVLPYQSPSGKFGNFWANLFSWWLMWAFNDSSLDTRQFKKLDRTETWFPVDEFIRRYGKN